MIGYDPIRWLKLHIFRVGKIMTFFILFRFFISIGFFDLNKIFFAFLCKQVIQGNDTEHILMMML